MMTNSAKWTLPILLAASGCLHAATFTVDELADDTAAPDVNPGDGVCEDSFNSCTLRAAIMEANALSGDDGIEFSVAGNVNLDSAVGALPTITDYVVIDGTTAPGFNAAATELEDALPVLLINGSDLTGSSLDGLRFSGAAAGFSEIHSIGIGNFPDNGIEILSGADSVIIQGCNISANGGEGIFAINTDFHVIGKIYGIFTNEFLGLGNLIANNDGAGIVLSSSDSNTLFGNFIGVLPDESGTVGNDGNGMTIIGNDNVIGLYDDDEVAGNIIGGNGGDGLRLAGSDNTVYANRIGTGSSPAFFGNSLDGIVVSGSANRIGSSDPNAANHVVNNLRGVAVGSGATSGFQTIIENNRIGLTTGELGNASHGIHVELGDEVSILGNVVINNGGHGILVAADDAIVRGNSVGVVGAQRHGNVMNGLYLDDAVGAIVGGDDPTHANIIGDNGDPGPPATGGVRVEGESNEVVGNFIGVTPNGADVGQPSGGLLLRGRFNTVRDNIIGRNGLGISLGGHSHSLTGNYIGTNPAHARLGNDFDGIRLEGDAIGFNCSIGPQNKIAFNGRFGIYGINAQPGGVVHYSILGNDIIANENAGLAVPFSGSFGSYNLVENRLRFNGNNGIFIFGSETTTRLFSNNMYGNGGIAVDINGGGQDPNDPGDPDIGPNRLMNTPDIHSVIYSVGMPTMGIPSTLEVQYSVDATAANATYPLDIEVFWTDRDEPMQGRYSLASVEYATPQAIQTTVFDLPIGGESGGKIAMIATDDEGNSSEMSSPLNFGQIELLLRDGFESFLGD